MNRIHLRRLLLVSMCFLTAACVSDAPPAEPGALGRLYVSTIPGIWSGQVVMNELRIEMVKTFRPDGTAAGVLLTKMTRPGLSVVMPEIRFESRWRVVGDVVETYDVKASAPGLFEPGEVIRDRIVSVRQDRVVVKAMDDGLVQVMERVKSSR